MSASVAGSPSSTTNYQQTTVDTPAVKQVQIDPSVGVGNIGHAGEVPSSPALATLTMMMGSLREFLPEMSGEKLQTRLLEVITKLRDAISETDQTQIELTQAVKRAALQDKQDKIDQALEKQAEAEEKRESLSVWDKIKIAFQYVGAIVAFLGAALALATSWLTGPAGVAAGVMLIAAGVILLGMAIDATAVAAQTDKTGKTGLGLVGTIHREVMLDKGATEEEAYQAGLKADTIGRIVATAVAGALMVGAAIANGVSTFQLGFSVMEAVKFGAAVGAVGSATTIAQSTGDIVVATEKQKATNTESEAKDLEGQAKVYEALAKFLDDMIDIVMTRIKGTFETLDNQVDSLTEAVQDTGATYGRVGLRT